MTGINREEILRRFEQWLDGALAEEEPPRGIDAELLAAITGEGNDRTRDRTYQESGDAYSLRAAVTALTQEVKLQGRSFKELTETVGSQAARMADRERDLVRETERRNRKEFLGVLIDLHDRLWRGLESVRASEKEIPKAEVPQGWLARLFSKRSDSLPDTRLVDMLTALKKGYEMGLERLDQTLSELDAKEIRCAGQAFDPRKMNAIDRQESSAVAEGTVIEVYRSGYEWNGEVFRPAQVKVACAPAGKKK